MADQQGSGPVAFKETTRAQWRQAAAAWPRWSPTLRDWLGPATVRVLDPTRLGSRSPPWPVMATRLIRRGLMSEMRVSPARHAPPPRARHRRPGASIRGRRRGDPRARCLHTYTLQPGWPVPTAGTLTGLACAAPWPTWGVLSRSRGFLAAGKTAYNASTILNWRVCPERRRNRPSPHISPQDGRSTTLVREMCWMAIAAKRDRYARGRRCFAGSWRQGAARGRQRPTRSPHAIRRPPASGQARDHGPDLAGVDISCRRRYIAGDSCHGI